MMNLKPLRFWCQKVLPLVYDDSLSYYELLCKVVNYLNNLISDTSQLSTEVELLKQEIENLLNSEQLYGMVDKVIREMYQEGLFDDILERILNEFNYAQPDLFSDYTTLAQYYAELDELANNSEWLQSINIGSSVMGTPIKCYVIGRPRNENQYYRNGLIFGSMHAREYQSTYVLANTIKMIVANLEDGTGSVKGTMFRDMFEGYRLFIVPCDNPDGYKLCAENYYTELPDDRKESVANMVTQFIRGGYVNENDFTPSELQELIDEFGSLENYTFREKDVKHVWNANINGIDLHYNSFNESMYDYLLAYSRANNYPQTNAPRNYIGETGFSCPENLAIKTLIDSYNITSVLDLHQRGPTMFFQYKYGGNKFERNKYISQEISNATQTPVSRTNNGQVGFMGWYHNVYTSDDNYGAIKEVGWSRVDILVNGASNPLDIAGYMTNPMPRELQPRVYLREINGILAFMYYAVCNMAINQFYMGLNFPDTVSQTPNNIDDAHKIVDLDYLKKNAYFKYVITSTDKTLAELVSSIPNDGVIILSTPNATNTPNIKLAGTSAQNKIYIFKHASFSFAIQVNSQDDAYICIITASRSTTWDMISARTGKSEITNNNAGTGSATNIAGTLFFEPIITTGINALDTDVRVTKQQYNNYWLVNIYTKGTPDATVSVDWNISSINYPSM